MIVDDRRDMWKKIKADPTNIVNEEVDQFVEDTLTELGVLEEEKWGDDL